MTDWSPPRTYAVPREQAAYLGYRLTVTQSRVEIHTPDGRPLATSRTLAGARRRIRSHRGIGRSTENV